MNHPTIADVLTRLDALAGDQEQMRTELTKGQAELADMLNAIAQGHAQRFDTLEALHADLKRDLRAVEMRTA